VFMGLCAVRGQDAERADDEPAPRRGARGGRAASAFVPERAAGDSARQSPAEPERAAAPDGRQPVDTSHNRREVYRAAYVPAQSLSNVLERHFRGVPGISLVSEPNSNSLLVSAPPEQFKELVDTIRKLDRVPKSATIDVTILDVVAADGGKAIDVQEFYGPSVKIRTKVNELKTGGQIRQVRRFRLTAIDNQVAQLQANGDKPIAIGPGQPFGAAARQAVGARNPSVGTTVQCTPRIASEGGAVIQLTIHDAPAALPAIGNEPPPPQGVGSQFQGTLSIPPGTTVVAGEIETETDQGPSRIVILVSADVLQAPAE
jgi:type II secretory pathway component GspD/PulD (secretin)